VFVLQASPALVLDSGSYDVTVEAECPNTVHPTLLPLHIRLASQNAYFILVSGQLPRAKLVRSLCTAAEP